MPSRPLRIGTRGSPMALYQAALVRDRLLAAHPELADEGAVELVTIRTTGDRVQNRLLAEIGGKGLFTKEIEEALLDRRIDLAVHSLKDMETWLPPGLAIACVLPRDDPRDVLVSRGGRLRDLPPGARIGTASLRRRAQLLRRRPDLESCRSAATSTRGSPNSKPARSTRWSWRCAASNGSIWPGWRARSCRRDVMLPAVGQGALAVECRADDADCDRVPWRRSTTPRPLPASPPSGRCSRRSTARAGRRSRACDDRRATRCARRAAAVAGRQRRTAGAGAGAVADADAFGRRVGERLRRGAGPEFGLD